MLCILKICRVAAQKPALQAFCRHLIQREGAPPPRTPPQRREAFASASRPFDTLKGARCAPFLFTTAGKRGKIRRKQKNTEEYVHENIRKQ
jgi:hypothetical protein